MEKNVYVEGLKKYQSRGVNIYVDGKESGPEDWEKMFQVHEDGSFYMGDYILAEEKQLKEIRFDKVHLESY